MPEPPDPSTPTSPPRPEDKEELDLEKKLIAFEIAEAAKKQVITWAKWIAGIAVAVCATLGIKTYIDIEKGIKKSTNKQVAIAQKEALDAFKKKANEELLRLTQITNELAQRAERTAQHVDRKLLARLHPLERSENALLTVNRRGKNRPIGSGLSISGVEGSAVTICCIVKDDSGVPYILTAPFDFIEGEIGHEAVQPASIDGGRDDDIVGTLAKETELAALIQISEGINSYPEIPEIGNITGISEAKIGETVRKYGRTTGFTEGTVYATSVRNKFPFPDGDRWIDCFIVVPSAGTFSQPGDGGAPAVNSQGEIIGMLFASYENGDSIVVPIRPILEELGVDIEVVRE